jgi:hypothetical protein
VSNCSAQHPTAAGEPRTVAEIVACVAAMENLDQFLIDELTVEEQDEFYEVLEQV